MNDVKVTIMIPVYNTAKYLRQCLDSVVNQTLKEIEIICINDGSTDNSLDILKEYARKDSRITLIDKNNEGKSVALNKALAIAKGEYLALVDSDDWIDNDFYEKLYTQAKNQNADIARTLYKYYFSPKKIIDSELNPLIEEKAAKNLDLTCNDHSVVVYNAIYKKQMLEANNICYFDEDIYSVEDIVFTARATINSKKTVPVTGTYYYYRQIQGWSLSTINMKKVLSVLKANERVIDLLNSYEVIIPNDYRDAFIRCILRYDYIFKQALKLKDFTLEEQISYINSFLNNYNKCKYKNFINRNINEKFFEYIKNNDIQGYINFHKKQKQKEFIQQIFSIKNENIKNNHYKCITLFRIKIKFKKNTAKQFTPNDYKIYTDYVQNNQLDKSKYVKICDKAYNNNGNNTTKLITFYLPQYHSFPENDKWFGRGFSEWSNVTKAVPQYTGHYQPHLPIDVGFYNLETTDVMRRQIELAKMYGIHGFSFYYYWFSGKKLMEKPLENFLKDKSLKMPFFMFWANEPWTKLWGSGEQNQILFQNELNDGDAEKFMADILPYMQDERYIKIDNKPVLVIYNPHLYKKAIICNFVSAIRQIAKQNGFENLYLMTVRKNYMDKTQMQTYLDLYNLDAILEFIPGDTGSQFPISNPKILNEKFEGTCYDVASYIKEKEHIYETNCKLFKGLFPYWDNTARKCYTGTNIFESTTQLYKTWLKDIINWTKQHNKDTEQFVFINAWNEWAEGAHLEPDQKYGYAYLQATKEALEETV